MKYEPSEYPSRGVGISLWERISRDPNYLKAKRKIQARYELPLPYDIRLRHKDWLTWLGAGKKPVRHKTIRGQAFLNDVSALFKKFEVPEAWHSDFIADIAGRSSNDSLEELSSLKFNLYLDNNGVLKWECIITPETDLTDPQTLELIQRAQKEYASDPPLPIRDKSDPRKLDWRPVHEWHQRHPLFTIKELAQKINHPPQTVRRKFAELENEK